MAALTPTYLLPQGATGRGNATEFGGQVRLFLFTVTPTTATDTLTLVRASDKIGTILSIVAQITAGLASTFAFAIPSFSGLVITLNTYNTSGAAATTWNTVDLWVLGV